MSEKEPTQLGTGDSKKSETPAAKLPESELDEMSGGFQIGGAYIPPVNPLEEGKYG